MAYLKQVEAENGIYAENKITVSKIGSLQGKDDHGHVLVTFDHDGPIAARLVAGLSREELSAPEYVGCEVLLTFENGNPKRPIITNLMSVPLESLVEMEVGGDFASEPKVVTLDGKKVRLEAADELVLSCGSASIMLKKDGKVIVKGESIVSRAKGRNHIEGGSTRVY